MKNFRKIISRFLNQVTKYRKIKDNPEERPVSKQFGTRSITFSVFTALTSLATFLYNPSLMESNILLGILIIAIVASVALIGPIMCFVQSLMSAIFQLKLNKKPIGWVALSLSIVSIAIAGIIVFFVFSSM